MLSLRFFPLLLRIVVHGTAMKDELPFLEQSRILVVEATGAGQRAPVHAFAKHEQPQGLWYPRKLGFALGRDPQFD